MTEGPGRCNVPYYEVYQSVLPSRPWHSWHRLHLGLNTEALTVAHTLHTVNNSRCKKTVDKKVFYDRSTRLWCRCLLTIHLPTVLLPLYSSPSLAPCSRPQHTSQPSATTAKHTPGNWTLRLLQSFTRKRPVNGSRS